MQKVGRLFVAVLFAVLGSVALHAKDTTPIAPRASTTIYLPLATDAGGCWFNRASGLSCLVKPPKAATWLVPALRTKPVSLDVTLTRRAFTVTPVLGCLDECYNINPPYCHRDDAVYDLFRWFFFRCYCPDPPSLPDGN